MEGKAGAGGERLLAHFTVEPIDRKRKQETKILIQHLASEETSKAHTLLASLLHKQNCSEWNPEFIKCRIWHIFSELDKDPGNYKENPAPPKGGESHCFPWMQNWSSGNHNWRSSIRAGEANRKEGKKQRWKVVESKEVGETLGRRKRLPTRAINPFSYANPSCSGGLADK